MGQTLTTLVPTNCVVYKQGLPLAGNMLDEVTGWASLADNTLLLA